MGIKVIKPSCAIVNEPNWDDVIISLEKAIRTCYKSEKAINATSADKLIRTGDKSIIKRGHESTLEHASMSVRFVCDRGVSHELVRHRHCSFSQESTRYVNYSPEGKNNDEGDMQFILPSWLNTPGNTLCGKYGINHFNDCSPDTTAEIWMYQMDEAMSVYNWLIREGWKPEQARSVLPNSLKTEIVVTTNMRDWRHIFHLRCDKTAHPQMRELMIPLWCELAKKCPTLLDSVQFDIHEDEVDTVLRLYGKVW